MTGSPGRFGVGKRRNLVTRRGHEVAAFAVCAYCLRQPVRAHNPRRGTRAHDIPLVIDKYGKGYVHR